MILLVEVDGIKTAIVGYAPGKNGEPVAIVIWQNLDGKSTLRHVKVSDCHPLNLPRKLERQLKRDMKTKGGES